MPKNPQFSAHIAEEVLEEYAFGRLDETKVSDIEEHLLVCEPCQEALADIDQYILLMKAATTRPFGSAPKGARIRYAAAALIAAAGLAAVFLIVPQRPARIEIVSLVAMRGDESAYIPAGAVPDIRIEIPDLADAMYRIEVVDAGGRKIWSGPAASLNNRLAVREPKALRAGIYWIRLYSAKGQLLREYGLHSS